MKITKLGHCCLIIEENGVKILTDPGTYTTEQNNVKDVDIVLITHEHQDHFHLESVKTILANNPKAKIITNNAVGGLLKEAGINCELLEDGQNGLFNNVKVEAHGKDHAFIYETVPTVMNTGFFIADRLFYPGDAFHNPGKPVEILALPVAGPWMKISESLNYAREINPKAAFPVHDGMLKLWGPVHILPSKTLEPMGIKFFDLKKENSIDI